MVNKILLEDWGGVIPSLEIDNNKRLRFLVGNDSYDISFNDSGNGIRVRLIRYAGNDQMNILPCSANQIDTI